MGGEEPTICLAAKHQGVAGKVTVSADKVQWAADASDKTTSVLIADINGQQRSKPGSAKAALRLMTAKAGNVVLEFALEKDRDYVVDLITPMMARAKEAAAAPPLPTTGPEADARKLILETDSDMRGLYDQLVATGVVHERDFWAGHQVLVQSKIPNEKRQLQGFPTAMVADVRALADGTANVVSFKITPEVIDQIFAEKPAVERAYRDNVPKNMTKDEFWRRFCQAEYMRQQARRNQDAHLLDDDDDASMFQGDDAATRAKEARAKLRKIDPTVNLAANSVDGLNTGYGVARDGRKESALALQMEESKVVDVIHDINRHGQVVIGGRISPRP
mmetsp:Transcript_59719/g.190020  ORF Transcript_59719/g.190020 Transcript_59719/m.190020 type:complete len:333 (-) Transcript_59719:14-1012(-)